MALLNEILVGRFNRFAQKLLSMKGGAVIPQLRGELGIEMTLQRGAEDRYLEGWDLFGVDAFPAAPGAGNLLALQLRNPPGSNVVAVVYRWQYSEGASTIASFAVGASLQINRGPITTDLTTAIVAKGWDARGRPSSTCIASANAAALVIPPGGQGVSNSSAAAFTPTELIPPPLEIPLLPGEILIMIGGNVNTQAASNVWWRERFLEDSERS